ncbi:MAG: YbaB/EbfC family nucleoid-associated protein [Clostridiales bacterium]|nr:YbaB/EbfC family nucleoid-associated protein [Candidatus Apopatousia equi]
MNNFRGGFGGGNMQNILMQAQKMQEEMLKKQEELENSTVSASVSGGMIECEMTGKKELKSIKINPQAVDPNDVEMLEDLIVACVNEASKKVDDLKEEKMGSTLPNGLF